MKHLYALAQKTEAKLLGKILKRTKRFNAQGTALLEPKVLQAVYEMYLNKPIIAFTNQQKVEKSFWESRFWNTYLMYYWVIPRDTI